MSALVARRLPPVPAQLLLGFALARAERVLDGAFTRRRSLRLDAAVLALEQAARPNLPGGQNADGQRRRAA